MRRSLSRPARMKNLVRAAAPPAENVELQLPGTEAVIRWYRRYIGSRSVNTAA